MSVKQRLTGKNYTVFASETRPSTVVRHRRWQKRQPEPQSVLRELHHKGRGPSRFLTGISSLCSDIPCPCLEGPCKQGDRMTKVIRSPSLR